jgi:restriction endonuclease S subunit
MREGCEMKKKSKRFLLKDIAEIQSGYLFKSRIVHDKEGNVQVIQLKDMDDSGRLLPDHLAVVNMDSIKDKYYLKKGDILFKAKSNKNVAGVVNRDLGIAVPTVHYLVVRVRAAAVIPEYLAWFMNQKPARKFLEARSAGTTIPIVTKKVLENMEVIMPPVETQQKVVAVSHLFLKEKEIMEQLIGKRKEFVEESLLKIIDGAEDVG